MKPFVNSEHGVVTLGNAGVIRTFSVSGNRLRTGTLTNIRAGVTLTPAAGTKEFVFSLLLPSGEKFLLSSDELTLTSVELSEHTAEFSFAPVKVSGTSLTVVMAAEAGETVLKKRLMLNSPNPENIKIDYIEFEHFNLGNDVVQRWSRPDMASAYLPEYHTALGQPVYVNGMFFGCEFPATDNNIVDDTMCIRYYSGKTLEELGNPYTTWDAVLGGARGLSLPVIRADFLKYIREISRPIYLRTQYNSWFDHMHDIDDEKIKRSFLEIEKGLTQHGVPPLDAYVVDDGFVDYTGDFWAFNQKFPNELYDAASLSRSLSSEFGLWLGPRGGYNSETYPFAQRMEQAGKGGCNKQSKDICIVDRRYLKNITRWMTEQTEKFGISYWKLDGFLLKPCEDASHGHPTGGERGMYCFTDAWEQWIRVFETVRECAKRQGKQLWINQTSYCNVSPWFLQWSESLWMQNSGDIGFIDETRDSTPLCGSDCDRVLTYRDSKYFDFYRTREYQFPLSNLYNHDPIYGSTANIHMSAAEFRNFLYMVAARGTAFWELYYSYTLFTEEHWQVNADVLRYLREYFHILRNAVPIGNSPDTGAVYGYCAWEEERGIVTLRNPANHSQEFSFPLDSSIGVEKFTNSLPTTTLIPHCSQTKPEQYHFGDTVSLTLSPHEVTVLFFGEPVSPLTFENARCISPNEIELRFNGHIDLNHSRISAFGEVLETHLLENYSDVRVTLPHSLSFGEVATLQCDITDVFGREYSFIAEVEYNEFPEAISGTGEFTLELILDSVPANDIIFSQGEEIILSLSDEKVIFSCKGVTVVSNEPVDSYPVRLHCIRERNGMLKLYLDGALTASAYDKHIVNPPIEKQKVHCTKEVISLRMLNHALPYDEV